MANDLEEDYCALLESTVCAMLSTTDSANRPHASYAPVIYDEARNFYVYISTIAKHANNLLKQKTASLMLIEDESSCENIFARKRVTYSVNASLIERGSDSFHSILDTMEQRHGSTVNSLRDLTDFNLFKLTPTQGRLVLGFGAAYQVRGENMQEIVSFSGKGHTK